MTQSVITQSFMKQGFPYSFSGQETSIRQVPPPQIEQALRELVRAQVERSGAQKGAQIEEPHFRVTAANMIFVRFSAEEALTEEEDAGVGRFLGQLPARCFIITFADGPAEGGNASGGITTYVRAREVPGPGGGRRITEEIYINLSEQELPALSSVLLSLVLPDVPTALCLLVAPRVQQLRHVLPVLLPLADRFIFDSSMWVAEEGQEIALCSPILGPLHGLLEGLPHELRFAPVDLEWFRIKRWRTLLAEQGGGESEIGGVAGSSVTASSVTTMKIVIELCAGGIASRSAQALFLTEWIFGCFQQIPCRVGSGAVGGSDSNASPDELHFHSSADGAPQLTLTIRTSALPATTLMKPGSISSVQFETTEEGVFRSVHMNVVEVDGRELMRISSGVEGLDQRDTPGLECEFSVRTSALAPYPDRFALLGRVVTGGFDVAAYQRSALRIQEMEESAHGGAVVC